MTKKIIVVFICIFCIFQLSGQNPIVPAGVYIADPEAHVWKDGNLYIYGSRDETNNYWCSYTHHVLSTNDLKRWNLVENALETKGKNDQIRYSNELLFAPDCAYKNGTYYFYYCSPHPKLTEGVATSKSPFGPFSNGKHIKGAYQIDPAVLIDKDGQGYYYWGQGIPKVAKLKANLVEIDSVTTIQPLDDTGNKAFHEGSSIRRIGKKYYLVFADESRRNRPTCLGYAIGSSPMGPFKYKGVIIDNYGSDPSVWNNHGSIEKFNGQWYVFYHRSTHNTQKFRKACVEPIEIEKDGSITEVEMTTQGAGEPLLPFNVIEAEWACTLSGNAYISKINSLDVPKEGLTGFDSSDIAVYKYLSFPKKINKILLKTKGRVKGAKIEVFIDSTATIPIGTVVLANARNRSQYLIQTADIRESKELKGIHALYLKFEGKFENDFEIDWFRFE